MACNKCEGKSTPCTNCNPRADGDVNCNCPIKDLSTDCSTYTGDDLECSGILKDTIMTTVIQDLDASICNKFEEVTEYLRLVNVGTGAKIFRSIGNTGNKEIRSIEQGDDIVVTEETETIRISNLSSTEAQKGVAQIATQAETDAGLNDEKIVTPAKLIQGVTTIVSDPSNLPPSSDTEPGVIRVATQAEVDAGTAGNLAVTPVTLENYISNPSNLPISTEINRGVAEIATQIEVNTGTDDEKIVTPAKLSVFVSNPSNLPDSTTTQKGAIELATQAEVDAGTDAQRAITPATLNSFLGNSNSFQIPIGLISMWSGDPNSLPQGWDLCDGTLGTPDLRGRFVVGFDLSNPDYNSVGNLGGLDEVTLTEAQMPTHSHSTNSWENSSQSVNDGNGSVVADQGTLGTIGDAGGDQPHENRPSYYTIAYIMYNG